MIRHTSSIYTDERQILQAEAKQGEHKDTHAPLCFLSFRKGVQST